MNVKVGSKWNGSDYSLFVVENVDEQSVYYAKCDHYGFASDKKFNCFIGAFLERFKETTA